MATHSFDASKIASWIGDKYDTSIIPKLTEYVSIPNASPAYDPKWATNGLIEQAANLLVDWVKVQGVKGLEIELITTPGRTPLIFIDIPASDSGNKQTILLYGHLDKQPPLTEAWEKGLGPYTPVIRDGKLYGRGAADDGYSVFAAVSSIKALQEHGIPHARSVVIIEAGEESGSPDLPYYINHLESRIGTPNLIVCLDSGSMNYEQMWTTVSLRGVLVGTLRVEILKEAVHSGLASGIVPDSFRIVRQLLSRIENEQTGEITLKELFCEIPEQRRQQIKSCAEVLGRSVVTEFPWVPQSVPIHGVSVSDLSTDQIAELITRRTWKPTVTVTGVDGIPPLENAGNVIRTHTSVKLSVRVPPRVDGPSAIDHLKKVLESSPPHGAHVSFTPEKDGSGWDAPPFSKWLEESMQKASTTFYKKPVNFITEGGSIPFMGMLGKKFPQAQFVITGVLGPQSNAHGPNEFLHIDYTKKITCCVASIIADHYHVAK